MNLNEKAELQKKFYYKSTHRGFKENDLILGKFADKFLQNMNENELCDYGKILEQSDENIYKWVTKKMPIPIDLDFPIMQKLLNFAANHM